MQQEPVDKLSDRQLKRAQDKLDAERYRKLSLLGSIKVMNMIADLGVGHRLDAAIDAQKFVRSDMKRWMEVREDISESMVDKSTVHRVINVWKIGDHS